MAAWLRRQQTKQRAGSSKRYRNVKAAPAAIENGCISLCENTGGNAARSAENSAGRENLAIAVNQRTSAIMAVQSAIVSLGNKAISKKNGYDKAGANISNGYNEMKAASQYGGIAQTTGVIGTLWQRRNHAAPGVSGVASAIISVAHGAQRNAGSGKSGVSRQAAP